MNRRTILRLLGGAGLAAPLVGLGSRALAARGGVPRIVFAFHPCGWQLREMGVNSGRTFDAIRDVGLGDQLSVIGVNNRVTTENGTGDAHTGGSATLLTGTVPTFHPGFEPPYGGIGRVYGSSISLDQKLAQIFGQSGQHVLGIRSTRGYADLINLSHRVLSRTGNTDFVNGDPSYSNAVFGEDDPARVRRRFFGDGEPTGVNAAALRAARERSMDFLDAELRQASGRSSATRRLRLDEHRSALADARNALTGTAVPSACIAPELGNYGDVTARRTDPMYPQQSDAQIANAVAALACDATRVLMLQYGIAGGGPNHQNGEWFFDRYGFDLSQAKRDLAEGNGGLDGSNLSHGVISTHAMSHGTSEAAFPYMFRIAQWHGEQVAKLAAGLRDVTTDTGNLLDDTIIVWFSENGQAPHGRSNTPFVLVGGSNWINHGREMEPERTTQVPLLRTLGRLVTQDSSFTIGDDDYAGDLERFDGLVRR